MGHSSPFPGACYTLQTEAAIVATPLQQSPRPSALCPLHSHHYKSLTQNQMGFSTKKENPTTKHKSRVLLAPGEHPFIDLPWGPPSPGPRGQHQPQVPSEVIHCVSCSAQEAKMTSLCP